MHKVYNLKFVMTKCEVYNNKVQKNSDFTNFIPIKKLHKQKINNESKKDLEKYAKIKTLEGFNEKCQKHL